MTGTKKAYINAFGDVIPKTIHEDGEQSLRLLIVLFKGRWKDKYLSTYKLKEVEQYTEVKKGKELIKWRPIDEQ
jgi:hypothetical protein